MINVNYKINENGKLKKENILSFSDIKAIILTQTFTCQFVLTLITNKLISWNKHYIFDILFFNI